MRKRLQANNNERNEDNKPMTASQRRSDKKGARVRDVRERERERERSVKLKV